MKRKDEKNMLGNMKTSLKLHEFRYVYGMFAGCIVFIVIALVTTTFFIPLLIGCVICILVVLILKNSEFKDVYDMNIKITEESNKESIINSFLEAHQKLNIYVAKITEKKYGEYFMYTLDGSVAIKDKIQVISNKLLKVANALKLEDVSTELARTLITLYLPSMMDLLQNYYDILMVGGSADIYEDEILNMLDKISESIDTTIKNIFENKETDIDRNSKILIRALERDKYIQDGVDTANISSKENESE